MRGTVYVVTSLCADGMTGVSPTSPYQSKVCKARLGQSARTTTGNSTSSSARSARYRTRSRGRCLRVRPRLARSRCEFDNEDLPSHTGFGASVHFTGKRQQRNREGNSARAMVEILPIRQWYTWFRNRFGGCLRRKVAKEHCVR